MAVNVKLVDGLAVASAKTYDAIAAASVKSYLGVDMTSGGTSYVTSVQNVSVTIAASVTSGTATITSVDTSLAVLFFGGFSTTSTTANAAQSLPRVELTNATTVTAYRNTSDSGTVTVNCTVVVFDTAAIQSIQAGTITIPGGFSGTATISSVTTANSAVFYLGNDASSNTSNARVWCGVTLTNATTVTAAKGASSGTSVVGFMVVEFKAAVIQSIQQLASTFTNTTSTTNSTTISSVTTGNTVLLYGGFSSTNVALDSTAGYVELSNSTTVTWTRQGTTSNTFTAYVTVLEFKSGVLAQSVQAGTITVSAATTNTATITAVGSKSFALFKGFTSGGSTSTPDVTYASVAQTASTTVTAAKGSSGAGSTTVAYSDLDFN